ncbi:MAG: DNA polymerase III subunit alpha [Bdellovibrionaceae bacterium]|nr:DNA polymerase III subunit alpha [Pseudobdellovibrionaceae bacterium]
MSFVHLHVHSQYSLLEATPVAKKIAQLAQSMTMPAVALTDNGNMFGAIEFYFACKDAGVKPLVGLDAYLAPHSRLAKGDGKSTRLVLLAQNFVGYQNLCHLSSIGYQEGFYYKPRIDYEVLEKYSSDVIALTGGLYGDVAQAFLKAGPDTALEKVKNLKNIFNDRLYLEMNRTGLPEWEKLNTFLQEVGKDLGIPVVAGNDVHYLKKEEQLAQEVLICIGSNKTLNDSSRFRLGSEEFYFKSAEQMRTLFKDIPEAYENTLVVADRCDLKFKIKDANGKAIYHLPSFPTAPGVTITEEMHRLTKQGLLERFVESEKRGETVAEELKPSYYERLKYEISVIENMGFLGYFLIVQDFINWAKTNDIPVGPGRGSGAGSLVAYCLKITDLDPIRYSLIFERFLNPERVSMPDFDVDFCQEGRGAVIKYVTEKYGFQSVSQIITYGRLQARAAIRDVGRVLGMAYAEVDVISKLMPDKLGITLDEALELEPRLREEMEANPQVNTLMDLARKIEGLVRHAGIHAAGVVIADGNLVDLAPLYKGADGENVIQYDMKHAEKIGLIKFDFLGLKTLTHIQDTLRLIEKNRGKKILSQEIPMSDPVIYSLMSSGDSAGVFQFEGEGITDALKKIKPTCFEDIMAINALYRPGPMDMIPEYTKRKHGQSKVSYLFPILEEALNETYGIIIYQEQVQLIAAKVASYSLGEADLLRRAMGKKIAAEMAQQKDRFVSGAIKNGYDKKKSEELFELMAEFANYGFNKSHSAAYCVIAAQTAWLKHYYPVEFFAALLSTEMSDTDKVVRYIKLCRRRGITIQAPHVSFSDYKFNAKGDVVYYSLGAIKGVGEAAVQAIIEARESLPDKKFSSLQEFFEVVDLRRVNKKVVECLIKAGALDDFGFHRAQIFSGYDKIIELVEAKRRDQEVGQSSLFEMMDAQTDTKMFDLPNVEVWKRSAQLSFEKEVLGFFLSDHPLNGYDAFCRPWTDGNLSDLKNFPHKKKVALIGMIVDRREIITKKGTRMAFTQFEDTHSSIELIAFPDSFAKYETLIKSEVPVRILAILEKDGDSQKLILEELKPVADLLVKAKKVVFKINAERSLKLPQLQERLKSFPGETRLSFELALPELEKTVLLDILDPQGVNLTNELFDSLKTEMGSTDFIEVFP